MTKSFAAPPVRCDKPRLSAGMQGIARVAVNDANGQLSVFFAAPLILPRHNYLLNPLSYSLTGGQRIFPRILRADLVPPGSPPSGGNGPVILTLDQIGDFSIYSLTVAGPDIDPFFSSARFSFRLACDDRFDCRQPVVAAAPAPELPVVIDYLTKDYASFRQALLDFIPTRLPGWTERSEADFGMMLLELLAATADKLSYLQDRVANEAYLQTATQRRSVAAHLALIGYQMDEGAAAHTWLQLQVNSVETLPAAPSLKISNEPAATDEPTIVFETLGEARLDPALNSIRLYDWGNSNCWLPKTAVSAALVGRFDQLRAGDYLILDGANRDVVRLAKAPRIVALPPPGSPPSSPPVGSGFITVVTWSAATPLHADYCLTTTSVRGNVVPATHGETVSEVLRQPSQEPLASTSRSGRVHLNLSNAPLAHLDPQIAALGAGGWAAPAAGSVTTRSLRSISTLKVTVNQVEWQQRPSLLDSGPNDLVYRVEIDDAGDATVVFGNGSFGLQPPDDALIEATYRVGGGAIGNVSAGTLTKPRLDVPPPWLVSVTNPVAATGGRDPEDRDHARRVGPATFRQPLVAVSASDYEAAAIEFRNASGVSAIQRANASFRWTGSWLTVTLATDPAGAEGLPAALRTDLLAFLETKRLAGYDLEVTGPIYVPLELEISFCAAAGAQQGDVQQELLIAFGNTALPGGGKGFFHPDNFTFGQSLYVSRIFAAIMAVPGVSSAQITRLARLHAAQPEIETAANLARGYLAVGLDEIIRLDNNPNFPQNGSLSVQPSGASL